MKHLLAIIISVYLSGFVFTFGWYYNNVDILSCAYTCGADSGVVATIWPAYWPIHWSIKLQEKKYGTF